MHKNLFKMTFVCLFLALAMTAQAQSWQFVGSRAMGMGGAGVATAYGPDAQYWNPAGLAQEDDLNETGLLINVGADMQATKNTLEGVRNLTEMADQYKNLENAISGGQKANAENINTIFKGLNDISKLINANSGVLVNANGGLGLKIKNFSVSARAIGTGAITPVVDTKNIQFNTGTGLTLSTVTAAPSTAANTDAANTLKNAIEKYGILEALNRLLGDLGYDSTQMANAIINAMDENGASPDVVSQTVNTVVENLGGASEILNQYAQATGSYKDNETLAMADVATFGEMSLGYGQKIIPGLKLGANVKVLTGYTAQSGVMILKDNEDIGDILDKAYDNKKSNTNLGIDLGALVNFSELLDKEIFLNPQVGLTAKNINGPKFNRPDVPAGMDPAIVAHWNHDKYQLKPQVRAGVAVNPIKNMTVAVDLDLTENDTLVKGLDSRQLGLGMEINVFNRPKFHIPLRVGYNTNLASSDVSDFITAGIGLNMLHFYLELAGAISTDTTKVEGNTIPNSAAVSLSLGFLF